MSSLTQEQNYLIRHADDVAPVPCPCGQAKRIITAKDGAPASLHVTTIYEAIQHYHKTFTEIYHILKGEGIIEIDGDEHAINPGSTIWIPPHVRHRVSSVEGIETVIVSVPAFNAEDEHFDD